MVTNEFERPLLARGNMPVSVEVPTTWLCSERDGERNRIMFNALREALSKQALNVTYEQIQFGKNFRDESAPLGGFKLSYHSVGKSPQVWRIKETPVPNYYSFDRFGFSGWSEIALFPERHRPLITSVDENEARVFTRRLRQELISKNASKYQQSDAPFSLKKPFIFFPLQTRYDVVTNLRHLDPDDVLVKAAKLARKCRIHLVVKRHPFCKSYKVRLLLVKLALTNPYVKITSASITKILPACSAVLVANSGVGFESLIHGKPVYSFADSEYQIAAHPIQSLNDIESAFTLKDAPDAIWLSKFVYYFLTQCCFDARNSETIISKLKQAELSAQTGEWPMEVHPLREASKISV